MKGKLRGAIIGCGAIAREHLAAVADLENAEIVAVCDLSPARAELTAERFGILHWFTEYLSLLDSVRPDLIHVTTPPSSHLAIASACLSRGYNVLCEKPIAADLPSFEALKKLAADAGRLLIENQNFRFHSGVQNIVSLQNCGHLGEIMDVQISIVLNIFAVGSPYIDRNVAHPTLSLRGGVIGDFLPHIAYLTNMFAGRVVQLRTIWAKRNPDSPLPADEFRGYIKGERATASVLFSGNGQPDGFWIRVLGTKAHVETNLFEPPRLTMRRVRAGEPALTRMMDGVVEARDVFRGSLGGFWRKLAGTSSYDGLAALIKLTYLALETGSPPPVTLDEIGSSVDIVERFTKEDFKL